MKIHLSLDEVRQACILYISEHPEYKNLYPSMRFKDVEFECDAGWDFIGATVEIVEDKPACK